MKAKFLKFLSLSLAALMLSLAFASCSPDGGDEASGTPTDGATETEISSDTQGTTEKETETASATDSETETKVETSANTGSETESSAVQDTESESETVAETDAEAETGAETDAVIEGDYVSSIMLAESLRGEVNATMNSDRTMASITNRDLCINYPFKREAGDGSLVSSHGATYLSALSKPFIISKAGDKYYSYDVGATERMNIYRLGSYYYEIHMLDGSFNAYSYSEEEEIDLSLFRNTNDVKDLRYDRSTGVLSFAVENTNDPYVAMKNAVDIDTSEYDALVVTVSSTVADQLMIYYASGGNGGFHDSRLISLDIEADGEYHTYVVPMSGRTDYTGSLTKIRFDIGREADEVIKISSLKAVKLEDGVPKVKLDMTYHLYSDKLNEVVRLVAEDTVSDLYSFGSETTVPKNTVEALVIKDKNGLHSSLDGVDMASVEYVAFDIKDAGIFGYILLPDESSGALSVRLEGDNYIITQEYVLPEGTTLETYDSVRSGHRTYTDSSHSFDAFLVAAENERSPLEQIVVKNSSDGAKYAGYDAFRGAYRFEVDGIGFSEAYKKPYERFNVSISVKGDVEDREIYVYTYANQGCLESGALLGENGLLLPIALEVCKNFQGENEESFYDHGDAQYGEILFPIVIGKKDTTNIHVVNLYQNWGNFPLKQISSIQFISPYYHLSYGTTETNCIAPYYVYGKDLWTLPDFRAMSAPLWDNQPQHTSVGRLYFLEYTTSDGERCGSESVDNKIDSYGPVYCDIDMNYISDDGKISAFYRHLEMPHGDENRTYYEIVLKVNETVTIDNFKNDFAFFSFDGRFNFYNKLGYLNEQNECAVTDANRSETPTFITLGKESPYVSYFDGPETDDLIEYVNFGLVIKNYDVTVGGESYDGNILLREYYGGGLNNMSLTLDLDEVTLQPGDEFVINMILLPWGDPSSANDSNVRGVRQDSCIDPYKIIASVGEVIEDEYLPRVKAADGVAEFTISGGKNNCVVRAYGYKNLTVPTVQELVDGAWVDYKISSERYEYDGYNVYYDGDGTYSYAFVINMDGADERTFRVTDDYEFKTLQGDFLEGDVPGVDKSTLPINVYLTPENYEGLFADMDAYGCTFEPVDDGTDSFFRFSGGGEVEGYITPLKYGNLKDYESTGQYFVMKYRIPEENPLLLYQFEVFTSTQNKSTTPGADYICPVGTRKADGEWHVLVVDLSAIQSYTADENGEYHANYFRVDVLNTSPLEKIPSDCYVDIAYFGISDSIEDICALNPDMEELDYFVDGSAKTIDVDSGLVS